MSIQFDKVQPKTKEQLKQLINYAFKHDIYDLNFIDTSKITNMSNLFANCEYDIDVSNWDVSNVKDMSYMFQFCNDLNCDLSSWDVSNVTNMRDMFDECERLECDLSNWNVSNVLDMRGMFKGCNKLTIPSWYKE